MHTGNIIGYFRKVKFRKTREKSIVLLTVSRSSNLWLIAAWNRLNQLSFDLCLIPLVKLLLEGKHGGERYFFLGFLQNFLFGNILSCSQWQLSVASEER